MTAHLFSPLTLRGVTLRNRIAVSPMCMYSSEDGFANDWHFAHLTARAVGGAALVLTEAAAVEARGRISPQDLGLWKDAHVEPLRRINRFMLDQGAVPGVQLAHAGRKASTYRPWDDRRGSVPFEEGGWTPVGPSPAPFAEGYAAPEALDEAGLREVAHAFREAARRALEADFKVIEIHAAHGYLLHSFLSPLTNRRKDCYGGPFENRTRLPLEVTRAVREVWPENLPLFVRLSATDWVPGGWTVEDSVRLATLLKGEGVDLVDCSSGGAVPGVSIPVGPNYQVPLAARVKEAGVMTGAVGMITEPAQADAVIREGRADLVFLARALLRDPYWPHRAAHALRQEGFWPPQYARGSF